jgi:1-phosphofructokinase family hexose kinase
MILAAGLTPALQQIYVFDVFRAGAVNRAVERAQCASGKVLNVGIALHLLGCKSRVLSIVGKTNRTTIDGEFAALGMPCRWIETAAPTRTCTTILDRQTGTTTELVENAGPISDDELSAFRAAFAEEAAKADFVVLTGSLPTGTPTDFYCELLAKVRCPVLLDIRGPELLLALKHRPLVVKPNREELAATVGRPLPRDVDVHDAMAELNERGAAWVVVSAGRHAVLVRGEGQLYRLEPPQLDRVVNPIGCGDVLAAGIAAAIVRGSDLVEAVRFGIAAAAESALSLLPARFEPSRVPARVSTIQISENE